MRPRDKEPSGTVGPFAGLRQARTFESLRVRGYRLLWYGQLGTTMGMWMDQVTRGWLVYQLTGSAFDLGVVSALRALPMLFLGLFAGVLVDRYSRKGQLVISQVANMVLNLVLATLVVTGRIEVWHIYATALIAGSVQTFQQPARQTMISDIVGRERLLNAISLSSAAMNLSRTVGPAVAGILIAFIGTGGSYFVQAFMFLWASVWTIQIPLPPGADRRARAELAGTSFMGSFAEGMRYVVSNRMILSLMLLGLVPMLLGMPYMSLLPVFAKDVLLTGVGQNPDGIAATLQGLLTTAVGIGALLGAVTLASLGQSIKRTGYLLLGGVSLFGLSLLAFSSTTWIPLALFFLFFAGLSDVAYRSQNQTAIQMMAPAKLRGRVVSVFMLDRAIQPLGSMLAGVLASIWGGPVAVAWMGGSCCLVAAIMLVAMPALRRLDLSTAHAMADDPADRGVPAVERASSVESAR